MHFYLLVSRNQLFTYTFQTVTFAAIVFKTQFIMTVSHPFSDRAKRRLRLAAKLLRRDGYKFDRGNFYQMIIETIEGLSEPERRRLRSYVDWLEEYEITEVQIYGWPSRSRARKGKTKSGKRGASRPAPPGAQEI